MPRRSPYRTALGVAALILGAALGLAPGCKSPEDGRPRGGGHGGDGGNYVPGAVHPPSKIDGTKSWTETETQTPRPGGLTGEPADPDLDPARGRRPRDLALLLLAIGTDPPRARARDQQADRAGGELRRLVLDRLAALDPEPEPEALDRALAAIVAEAGEPTGPTRGVCSQVRQEWEQTQLAPDAWAWLLSEALGRDTRGDRRGAP